MNNSRGFSVVMALVGFSVVAGITVFSLNKIKNSNTVVAKNENKFNTAVLNSLIMSKLGYEDSCKSALGVGVPGNNLAAIISNGGGELQVILDGDTVAKKDANIDRFNTTIRSLRVVELAQTGTAYGLRMFSGKVNSINSMNKNIIVGNKIIPDKKIGQIQFLVNSAGNVVSCSAKGIEDSTAYADAKTAEAVAAAAAQASASAAPSYAVASIIEDGSSYNSASAGSEMIAVEPVVTPACGYSSAVCDLYSSIGRNVASIDAEGANYWQAKLDSGVSQAAIQQQMAGIVKNADEVATSMNLPSSQTLLNGNKEQQDIYYNTIAPNMH